MGQLALGAGSGSICSSTLCATLARFFLEMCTMCISGQYSIQCDSWSTVLSAPLSLPRLKIYFSYIISYRVYYISFGFNNIAKIVLFVHNIKFGTHKILLWSTSNGQVLFLLTFNTKTDRQLMLCQSSG